MLDTSYPARSGRMRVTLRLLLFIGLQLISVSLAAHSDRYDCEVKEIVKLNDAGNLIGARSESAKASLYKFLLRDTFVIDRLTGHVHGSAWFNTSIFEEVTIISNGTEDNEFRVVSVGRPPTSTTTFLYIRATAKGHRKPFMIMDSFRSELVFSGTCK